MKRGCPECESGTLTTSRLHLPARTTVKRSTTCCDAPARPPPEAKNTLRVSSLWHRVLWHFHPAKRGHCCGCGRFERLLQRFWKRMRIAFIFSTWAPTCNWPVRQHERIGRHTRTATESSRHFRLRTEGASDRPRRWARMTCESPKLSRRQGFQPQAIRASLASSSNCPSGHAKRELRFSFLSESAVYITVPDF